MFYEVRIFDAKGYLRKVISPRKLSNIFWKQGEQNLIDFGDKENRSQELDSRKRLKNECHLEDH
jgi:hypothetical protein